MVFSRRPLRQEHCGPCSATLAGVNGADAKRKENRGISLRTLRTTTGPQILQSEHRSVAKQVRDRRKRRHHLYGYLSCQTPALGQFFLDESDRFP